MMFVSLVHSSSVFYFLNFSVLHICNLVERITKDETRTTQNYLWSADSWVSSTQLDAIRPTLISSNKRGLSSKAAPCLPSWYLNAASPQHLGVLTGTTTPTHVPNSSGVPTTPEAYRWRAYSHFCSNTGNLCGISN